MDCTAKNASIKLAITDWMARNRPKISAGARQY